MHRLNANAEEYGTDQAMGGVSWTPNETQYLLFATNIACASGLGGRSSKWKNKDNLINALVTDLPDDLFYTNYNVYDNYIDNVFKTKINPTLAKVKMIDMHI